MAGTDSSRARAEGAAEGAAEPAARPVVILDRPQIGENIGAAARAMLNCGLTELRLVAPREAWPNDKARAAASGADAVLEGARLYDDVPGAVADLARLYATTARPRDMVKPVLAPRDAAAEMAAALAGGARVGVLFGPERAGLGNDDVARADAVIEAPLNPGFASLNLAQAVLLIAWEWRMAALGAPPPRRGRPAAAPAAKGDIENLFKHLESELDAAGFLHPPEKRPRMVRNIRNVFGRAGLTDQEVRTLRGVVAALAKGRGSG